MIFTGESSEIKEVLIEGEGWVTPYMGKVEWGHFTIESQGVRQPGFRIPVGPDESFCGPVTSILAVRTKH